MARVLVVDDDDVTRVILRRALEHAGYEVCEAEDGAAALDVARGQLCDVVVMDIVMPVKGGLETLIELRGTQPGIGVVLMSGTAQTAAGPFQHLAERLGVEHVFTKPIPLDRLLAAVAGLTSRKAEW